MAREALKLAARHERPELAESIRARIALYQAGKPYREPSPTGPSSPARQARPTPAGKP
jgi:hypothetical protein